VRVTPAARFVAFNAVGAMGAGVQLASVALLSGFAHVHYAVTTPVAVAVAVAHNFVWHRRWTWRDRRTAFWPAFGRFALSNGIVSLIGNLAVMTTLVSGTHVPAVPASLGAIAVCGLLNFVLGDVMVFRD
jgi:putative flippase GtrA